MFLLDPLPIQTSTIVCNCCWCKAKREIQPLDSDRPKQQIPCTPETAQAYICAVFFFKKSEQSLSLQVWQLFSNLTSQCNFFSGQSGVNCHICFYCKNSHTKLRFFVHYWGWKTFCWDHRNSKITGKVTNRRKPTPFHFTYPWIMKNQGH